MLLHRPKENLPSRNQGYYSLLLICPNVKRRISHELLSNFQNFSNDQRETGKKGDASFGSQSSRKHPGKMRWKGIQAPRPCFDPTVFLSVLAGQTIQPAPIFGRIHGAEAPTPNRTNPSLLKAFHQWTGRFEFQEISPLPVLGLNFGYHKPK